MIRDIRTLFEQDKEKNIINLKEQIISGIIIILNVKVMVTEIETYYLTNISIKLILSWGIF